MYYAQTLCVHGRLADFILIFHLLYTDLFLSKTSAIVASRSLGLLTMFLVLNSFTF